MINQSINSIESLLLDLTKESSSYYIKQKNLSSFVQKSGNIIYSHYKPYQGEITPTLIKQHLNKEITLAIDLKKDNILLYKYRGKRAYAFGVLFFKLISKDIVKKSHIIKYSDDTLLIYLELKNKELIEEFKEEIEKKLLFHLEKEWKVYPIEDRPKIGNLMELPREFIELPWSF